ncbi:hypothetical protein M409DRAFT_16653 [Zasmidium cellare ATCC 36951]|uniref:CFEM domain-containing protein n=1 Tax=Zasmidium cellare ATCC 36951 TaxID=1080233 RepID=A0A6A6D3D3_ZASCE|nr:uncharacterized protein M409DRAFT_16653 [Zasmidium cellare ATCC 36951]KAF2172692.1 hypothetical protein M409DRAFT_16653 [Zasmidium cellare ATCC 36951]
MLLFRYIVGVVVFVLEVQGAIIRSHGNVLAPRQSQLPSLSTCSQSCIAQGLPASGCDPKDVACLCTSVPYTNAVTACLTANCTVVDSLEARRYSAITCGEPVRDHSELTKRVSWTMFTLATIGLISRFLSRLPALNGSGFGWDDWTILLCWILLIPSDGILTSMADTGLGQDIWILSDPNHQITKILYLFYVSEYTGTCVNLNALIFATAAINIILDFAVILLPIPKLWSLSIATRKKVAVCVTFCIGLFVTLCSIIRLRTLAVWGSAPNVTWLYNPIAIWSNTEINLGVVCACMPAIAGLIQRSYTLTTGKKFSSYGRHSAMLRSGGQNEDRNYEVRLNSFSDGSAKYHGYNEGRLLRQVGPLLEVIQTWRLET